MPATAYLVDSQNLLRSVDIVFQVMAKAAYRWNGLFPAVAERQNGNLLMDFPLPAPIPGQRNSDRAPRGCNLAHDVALLAAMDGLGKSLDRERYLKQRSNYLETFARVCAPTSPTGLLPWGEHAYWNLQHGTIANSYLLQYGEQPLDAGVPTHHQLGMLPLRDWHTIHEANPEALPRFVDGLEWHWDDDEHSSFNRHAPITQFIRGYQVKRGSLLSGKPVEEHSGSDFPGSAGTAIHDYAAALALVANPKAEWKQQSLGFSDYWWERRLDSGLLPKSSGADALSWNGVSLGQTLSHAHATLQAAEDLKEADAELSALLRERGCAYADAVLSCPQPQIDDGRFASSWNTDGSAHGLSQAWAGNRGQACTAKMLGQVLAVADLAGDERGFELVERGMAVYADSLLPSDTIVRAGDPGAVIAMLTECLLRRPHGPWRERALLHATVVMERFFDAPLPRMAQGRSHYEAQQGSGVLIHSLARLICVEQGYDLCGGLAKPIT
jgi:hypothetical protein